MTEEVWLGAVDLRNMLGPPPRHAPAGFSPRKLRLLAVACCRRLPAILLPAEAVELLDVAEASADGGAGDRRREGLFERVVAVRQRLDTWTLMQNEGYDHANYYADELAHEAVAAVVWAAGERPVPEQASLSAATALGFRAALAAAGGVAVAPDPDDPVLRPTRDREMARHADFARDILGNPFRPVPFSTEWRTDTAVMLAHQMYESREFAAMPILGDALRGAGCDEEEILNHCRSDGVHVRGCWVVDLVLGKE